MVTAAFGKLNDSLPFMFSDFVAGGPSGSAWLLGPSECHTYCSAPNVTIVTGPVKCAADLPFASAKSIFTACAFDGSLLISISDHSPPGRFTAYAVTSTCPASSLTSASAGNNWCTPAPCFTHSRLTIWLAKYCEVCC